MLEYWGFKNNPFTRDLYFNNLYSSENFSNIVRGVEKEVETRRRLVLILRRTSAGYLS